MTRVAVASMCPNFFLGRIFGALLVFASGVGGPCFADDPPVQYSGTFVFYKGQIILTRCDGTMPTRVAITDGYPELARIVHPLRTAERNGLPATVRGRMQVDSNGGMSQVLVVSQVVSTEKPVACDPLATDRPFAGTRWVIETDGEAKYPRYAMRFVDRDRFEGADACNLIFGRFEMKSDHEFIVRDMQSTLRACPGGSYHAFVPQLDMTYMFNIRGRVLTLSSQNAPPYRWLASEWDAH